MSNKKIIELFKSKGFLFPSTSEEIEEFEKNNDLEMEILKDWNNPTDILKRGIVKLEKFDILTSNLDISNLSIAAREGKEISEQIRKQMKEDKKNAKKKK